MPRLLAYGYADALLLFSRLY